MDMSDQHASRQSAFELESQDWPLASASENQLADQDDPLLPALSSRNAAQSVGPEDRRGDDDPLGKEHGLEAVHESESEHSFAGHSRSNFGSGSAPDLALGVDGGNSDPASPADASSQPIESPAVTASTSPEPAAVVLGNQLAIPADLQVPAEASVIPLQDRSAEAPGMARSALESASMAESSLFCALPDSTAAEGILMAGDNSSGASSMGRPARLIESRGDVSLYKTSRHRYEVDLSNGDDNIKIDMGRRGLWGYRALGVEAHQDGVQVVLRDKDEFGLAVFNEQGNMISITALTGGQLRRCETLFDQDFNRDGSIASFSARLSMPMSGMSAGVPSLERQSLLSVEDRSDLPVPVENTSMRAFVD